MTSTNDKTYTIGKNIKVSIQEYRGKQRLDIRHYYKKDEKLEPTSKGINIPVDDCGKLIEKFPSIKEKLIEINPELSKYDPDEPKEDNQLLTKYMALVGEHAKLKAEYEELEMKML